MFAMIAKFGLFVACNSIFVFVLALLMSSIGGKKSKEAAEIIGPISVVSFIMSVPMILIWWMWS